MNVTRSGVGLGLAAPLLAAAGFAAGYPELVLVAAAAVAALAAALVWTARPSGRVEAIRSFAPAQPRAGQAVTVALAVTNAGARPSPALPVVERIGEVTYRVDLPRLDAFEQGRLSYEIPAVRRGRLTVRRPRVDRCDPLGLASRTVLPGDHAELRVHPDWHAEVRPLTARGLEPDAVEAAAVPRGDVVFHSLRDYRPGDPPRAIHWRATARRGGTPVVRQSADPEAPAQVLILDVAAAGYHPDAFEEAVRITASLAMAAHREALALELHTTDGAAPLVVDAADQSGNDARAALDRLADVTLSRSAARIDHLVDGVADAVATRGGSAVLAVVAGRSAESAGPALARAVGRFEAVYVIRVGAGDWPVPVAGVVHVNVATSREFAAAQESGWWW